MRGWTKLRPCWGECPDDGGRSEARCPCLREGLNKRRSIADLQASVPGYTCLGSYIGSRTSGIKSKSSGPISRLYLGGIKTYCPAIYSDAFPTAYLSTLRSGEPLYEGTSIPLLWPTMSNGPRESPRKALRLNSRR